jgi:uncharacterized membrane-anchored protein
MTDKRFSWRIYVLAALFPLAILLFLPVRPLVISRLGSEILLEIKAADPPDHFRGDYIALSLPASQVPLRLFAGSAAPKSHSRWYISMQQKGACWMPSAASQQRPDGVYLEGTVLSHSGDTVRMDYGTSLSRFYIPEDTGEKYQRMAKKGVLRARVKVWHGAAVLQSLEEAEK